MTVVPMVLFAASFDGVSVLAAAAAPAMRRLLGMRPSAAAWPSLPFSPVAASHCLYSRNDWNDAFSLAVYFAFVASVCIAAVSVAAASMRSRPTAAALRLLFVNFLHRCHDANLSLSLAAVIVCVVVAGITGLFIAAATPGTRCVVVLPIFVADVVNSVAAAPLAAIGSAFGASLDAVADSSSRCFRFAASADNIILIIIIRVGLISEGSGLPNLSQSS